METLDLDILKMEYIQACNQRKYLDDQANKYVSYIVAFLGAIGALLGLLVKNGEVEATFAVVLIIVVGALVLGMLFIMMLHHTIQCYRLGGYIKYLEEEINKKASFHILKWETDVVAKYIHRDSTSLLVYSIVGVFFVAFLIIAGVLAVKYIIMSMPIVFVIVAIIGLLELATACVYLVKLWKAHDAIYQIVKREDHSIE